MIIDKRGEKNPKAAKKSHASWKISKSVYSVKENKYLKQCFVNTHCKKRLKIFWLNNQLWILNFEYFQLVY